MQAAIDNKLDVTVHEAAVKALGAQIEGIETGLSNLANGAVKRKILKRSKMLRMLSKR